MNNFNSVDKKVRNYRTHFIKKKNDLAIDLIDDH
jgi:hypothetical protein